MIHFKADDTMDEQSHREIRLIAERAALLFHDNGWTWYADTESPDADRIATHLILLIFAAVEEARGKGDGYGRISAGRLYATAYRSATTLNGGKDRGEYAIELGITFTL